MTMVVSFLIQHFKVSLLVLAFNIKLPMYTLLDKTEWLKGEIEPFLVWLDPSISVRIPLEVLGECVSTAVYLFIVPQSIY